MPNFTLGCPDGVNTSAEWWLQLGVKHDAETSTTQSCVSDIYMVSNSQIPPLGIFGNRIGWCWDASDQRGWENKSPLLCASRNSFLAWRNVWVYCCMLSPLKWVSACAHVTFAWILLGRRTNTSGHRELQGRMGRLDVCVWTKLNSTYLNPLTRVIITLNRALQHAISSWW